MSKEEIKPSKMTDEKALRAINKTLDTNRVWQWYAEYCVDYGNKIRLPTLYHSVISCAKLESKEWIANIGVERLGKMLGYYPKDGASDLNKYFTIDRKRFCEFLWAIAKIDPQNCWLIIEFEEEHKAWELRMNDINFDWEGWPF